MGSRVIILDTSLQEPEGSYSPKKTWLQFLTVLPKRTVYFQIFPYKDSGHFISNVVSLSTYIAFPPFSEYFNGNIIIQV